LFVFKDLTAFSFRRFRGMRYRSRPERPEAASKRAPARADGAESWAMPFDKLKTGFRDAALRRGFLSHEVTIRHSTATFPKREYSFSSIFCFTGRSAPPADVSCPAQVIA
jgi:hypothetical protein